MSLSPWRPIVVDSGKTGFGDEKTAADIDRVIEAADGMRMEAHLILKAWWAETEAGVATRCASETEIVELETRYGVSLPNDFRSYLAHGVPIADNWDAEDGNWWPLTQIKNIPDEYQHVVAEPIASHAAKHLFFLDHLQWCWAWAISCVPDETFGRVALIGGHSEVYVADSFTDFVEQYISSWCGVSRVPEVKPKNDSIWGRLLGR